MCSSDLTLIFRLVSLQWVTRKDECGVIYLKHLVDKYGLRDIEVVKYTREDILRSDFVYDYVVAMQDNYGMEV